MRNVKLLQRICFYMLLAFTAVACNDDDSVLRMKEGEGEMTFSFIRLNGFGIASLDEIATIKITLEKDGVRQTLKSLKMDGVKDSVCTEPVFLEEGSYRIIRYNTYDVTANLLTECEPLKDNLFTVDKGEKNNFNMPFLVNDKIDKNNILNTLYAICTEALGTDRSLWPATWTTEHELQEWENLDFEYNSDGSVAFISGLTLDHKFAPMKKLSAAIANFASLQSLIIRDNALEELPANFGALNIGSLQIINTNLSSIPESAERLTLFTLYLEGNNFTSIPEVLYTQRSLQYLGICNEPISVIDDRISAFENVNALTLSNLGISALPDVFDTLYRISTLNISGNKQLTSLPATIRPQVFGSQRSYLRGIKADGCGFTSIPDEVKTEKFKVLNFAHNQIISLSANDLESMPELQTLYLSGNKLSAFPVVELPNMNMLVLIDCGLTPQQIERAGMPNLMVSHMNNITGTEDTVDFLFFTQEQFDAIFKGHEVPFF